MSCASVVSILLAAVSCSNQSPQNFNIAAEAFSRQPGLPAACVSFIHARYEPDAARFHDYVQRFNGGSHPRRQEAQALERDYIMDYNGVMDLCDVPSDLGTPAQAIAVINAGIVAVNLSQVTEDLQDKSNACRFAQQGKDVIQEAQSLQGYADLLIQNPALSEKLQAQVHALTDEASVIELHECTD